MRSAGLLTLLVAVALGAGCQRGKEVKLMAGFNLTSPDFEHEGMIPRKFTCQGDDVCPALSWSGAPEGTVSFALVMDDPDAPGHIFDHYLVCNIPADVDRWPAQAAGVVGGRNSWGNTNYGGPCPPSGTHRYVFKLYALDATLELSAGFDKKQLEDAVKIHGLARAELMGRYKKE